MALEEYDRLLKRAPARHRESVALRRQGKTVEEVAETLRAIGIEPIMAEATARRQEWSAQLDLRSHFGPDGPKTYREVLDIMASGPKV